MIKVRNKQYTAIPGVACNYFLLQIIALLFVASLLVDVARASQYYEGAEEGGEVGGSSGDAYGSEGGEAVSDHGYGSESHGGHGAYEAYGAGGGDHSYGHAFDAAILSHHEVKPYLVHSTGHVKPTVIDVEPGFAPIHLNLLSKSSPLETSHRHIGEKGSFKKVSDPINALTFSLTQLSFPDLQFR